MLDSGHRILHFERIDSTNAEARRLTQAGEAGPLWIVADEQTGGRGRLGRSWVSEPGNLYATLLFSTSAGPEAAAQVSFVAALAVHEAVSTLLPHRHTAIKWPNDVLVDGAKICGILAEVAGNAPVVLALGCGLNIAHFPEGTPYPVTSLVTEGASAAVPEVFEALDASFSRHLAIWNDGAGFGHIRKLWEQNAIGLGEAVTIHSGDQQISGLFDGLALDGALIVSLANGTHRTIHAGDVRFAAVEALRQRRA
ncbi:biotin--[acetyl-CoA-carboxylase] ligase [Aestuariivirga sp.]|uniref:biotin--[acetyl-CoA-carboxylase] ligase n=1 Tax=Aestuariivirga sp. TaxID=2650926 RepID=UPI0039E6FDBC